MSRGGAVRLARQAHNLKVAGSNPAPATCFGFPSHYILRHWAFDCVFQKCWLQIRKNMKHIITITKGEQKGNTFSVPSLEAAKRFAASVENATISHEDQGIIYEFINGDPVVKTTTLNLLMNPAEKQQLEEQAAKAGFTSVTKYILRELGIKTSSLQ